MEYLLDLIDCLLDIELAYWFLELTCFDLSQAQNILNMKQQ